MGMAKRKYSKRSNKIEPSVMSLTFAIPSTSGGNIGTSYVDLSQVASLVNRRFYRQGINWAVSGIKFIAPDREPLTGFVTSNITVSKLPNTWVMNNAWTKGFKTWQKMNREALAETESIRPKFLDFKIYADADHHTAGYGGNLMPLSLPNNIALDIAVPGEWESSKFEIPTSNSTGNTSSFEVIATGGSFPGAGASGNNAVSLIEGYAASRGLPNILDPNTPADADDVGPTATPENWLASVFNEGTQQDAAVLADMISENNIAPYPFEGATIGGVTYTDTQYPGGANQLTGLEIHDIDNISATTIGGMTRIKGGNFPCGLIRIDHSVPSWAVAHGLTMIIELIPGTHRGYLCESMLEA